MDLLDDVLGVAAAEQIEDAVAALRESTDTSGFVLISVGVVVYSASALFVAWRDTLELIRDVPYESSLARSLRSRAFGALVPIGAGILLAAIIVSELVLAFAEQLLTLALLDALVKVAGTMVPTLVGVAALGLLYRHGTRTRRPRWEVELAARHRHAGRKWRALVLLEMPVSPPERRVADPPLTWWTRHPQSCRSRH